MAAPGHVAVFDHGKTSLKLILVDEAGAVAGRRTVPNHSLDGPPWPRIDVAGIERWLVEGLGAFAQRARIEAIVATTHGCGFALVDGADPVLPVMDYEAAPPADIDAAYDRVAPGFEECFTPRLPLGLNGGRQLFWQQQAAPAEFARARQVLALPQFWARRLGGDAASEVTSLACHGHLWDPRRARLSSLVEAQGWSRLFPPLAPAWRSLGRIDPAIARATGVPVDCRIVCGVHDSNAAWSRHLAAGRDLALASTGTWVVCFSAAGRLDALDPARDTLANVDVEGNPVCCSRFMGGREYAAIAGDAPPATREQVEATIADMTLALPGFAGGGGPFPGQEGRILGPAPRFPAALATLQLALLLDVALDLAGPAARIVIDGAHVANAELPPLLAALRAPARVEVSVDADGVALGAAMLARRGSRMRLAEPAPRVVDPAMIPGLAAYRAAWHAALAATPARR
jgi:L-fuculokinase